MVLLKVESKAFTQEKGVSKKDTIMNLTKKSKVSGNGHPAYREWEDNEKDYTGCN